MSNHDGSLHVVYLGPEASFSHQAAIEVFQSSSSSSSPQQAVSLHPLPSFSAIFSAIQNSSRQTLFSLSPPSKDQEVTYDYAIIPIENSTNGSVVQVLDLLANCGLDSHALYPDLEVCAEYYLPVHHCLFVSSPANQSSTSDGNSKDELRNSIRTIYTHPQVWGQCYNYLSRHFSPKLVERIDVGSTSAAAQLVARGESSSKSKSTATEGTSAAISSKLAGEKHDLLCLAENIEDEPGKNTTRFFVVRNKRHYHNEIDLSSLYLNEAEDERRYKSLITFTIPHTKPGALADTLAVFKHYGFNLTSIDTRPSRKRNWQYVFFVECEEASPPTAPTGRHQSQGGAEENQRSLLKMLDELSKFTESLRYLGRFVDRLPKEDGN